MINANLTKYLVRHSSSQSMFNLSIYVQTVLKKFQKIQLNEKTQWKAGVFSYGKVKTMFHSLSEKLDQMERNWNFAANSNFLILISLQPDSVNLWFILTEFKVRNIKVLHHRVAEK